MASLIRNISDTARWVTIFRAEESERPDAVFHDRFARRLAGDLGEAAALVSLSDPATIAERLDRWALSPERLRAAGEAARYLARHRYNWQVEQHVSTTPRKARRTPPTAAAAPLSATCTPLAPNPHPSRQRSCHDGKPVPRYRMQVVVRLRPPGPWDG